MTAGILFGGYLEGFDRGSYWMLKNVSAKGCKRSGQVSSHVELKVIWENSSGPECRRLFGQESSFTNLILRQH